MRRTNRDEDDTLFIAHHAGDLGVIAEERVVLDPRRIAFGMAEGGIGVIGRVGILGRPGPTLELFVPNWAAVTRSVVPPLMVAYWIVDRVIHVLDRLVIILTWFS
jgi:hypothetical protein